MTTTNDFNHLLDLPNVQAVDYNPNTNTVTAMVTHKVPEEDLDPDDLVRNHVDTEQFNLVVEDLGGEIKELIDFDRHYHDARQLHRPVLGGLNSGGKTEGVLAQVDDVTAPEATWDTNLVANGDIVRLSNCHAYWTDNTLVTDEIGQPDADSPVGRVCGGVKRFQGDPHPDRTDVAARTCYDLTDESTKLHLLPGTWPTGVFRGDYTTLVGIEAAKTGGATGATFNRVDTASTNILVSGGTVNDVLKIHDLSDSGDSGSPVVRADTGEIIGINFAGNDNYSFIIKATNIETDLGVTILTEKPTDPTSGATFSGGTTATAKVPMADPAETTLEVENVTYGNDPEPGETVEATLRVKGSSTGSFYVDCQGARYYEFEMTAEDLTRGGTYDAYYKEVRVNVTAPDNYQKSFDVAFDVEYYS